MNYLLIGKESYLLRQRKNEIISKTVSAENREFGVSFYNGFDEPDIEEIIGDCKTLPFFCDSKVVVLDNPLFMIGNERKKAASESEPPKNEDEKAASENETDAPETSRKEKEQKQAVEQLTAYLANPMPETTLIIICENPAKTSLAYKNCLKYCKLETFNPLTQEEFSHLVGRDLIEQHIEISDRARQLLMERLPLDVENWKQELNKLTCYPGKINEAAILELINRPLEDNVYALSNAVLRKDAAKANAVLHDLLFSNANSVFSLAGLLASSFRLMFQVKLYEKQGYSRKQIYDALSPIKPQRIDIASRNAYGKSAGSILAALNDLADLDLDIKSGRINDRMGLELFILRNTQK